MARQGVFHAADGTPLYYEIEGKGRPLILCYGLTCRRTHWRYQREHFKDRYQIISFDYRGHHASGMPKNDQHLTVEWCGRDVVSLVEHLNLSEAVVLGHSMGVAVAVEAMRQTKKIKGGVFICGAVTDPFAHMLYTDRMQHVYKAYAYLFDLMPDVVSLGWKRFTQASGIGYFVTSRLGFNPARAQVEDVKGYMEGVNCTKPEVFASLLGAYVKYDGRGWLKEIRQPVLIIAGEKDCITPLSVQEEMAELLPKAEIEYVPFGSHNAHMDFAERVNHRIDEFFKENGY